MPQYGFLLAMALPATLVLAVVEGLSVLIMFALMIKGMWLMIIPVMLLAAGFEMYLMMVLMRGLGLLYHHKQEQLGWYST